MKKIWDKYKNIFWFFVITFAVVWFVIEFVGFKNVQSSDNYIWGILLCLDTATAIALSVLALLTYFEYAKGEDEIPVILSIDGKEIKEDKLKLLRKYTTRNEILGILGMIQNDSTGRFDFKYLSDFEFLEQINEVQKGKKDEIKVKLTKKEFIKYFSNFFNADISDAKKEIEIILEAEGKKYKINEKINIYNISENSIKTLLEKYLKNEKDCVKSKYFKDDCFRKNINLIEEGCESKLVIKFSNNEFQVFDKSKFEELKDENE